MKIITVVGAISVAVLLFFSIIFAIASVYAPTRLIVAALLFAAALGIAYVVSRQPKSITQKVELSGQMQTVALKCPNCAASIDANSIKLVSGVPYATCPYCGRMFEVAEEPKW